MDDDGDVVDSVADESDGVKKKPFQNMYSIASHFPRSQFLSGR